MQEFSVEFELQGLRSLKLRIKGSRDDVAFATKQVGRQVAELLQPALAIVEGEEPEAPRTLPAASDTTADSKPKRPARPRRRRAAGGSTTNGGGSDQDAGLTFTHDASRWGNPLGSWKGWEKAVWLLYVVRQQTEHKELTAPQIVRTFNRLFPKAGELAHIHISRDLARRLTPPQMLVTQDASQTPARWGLLDNGVEYAEKLVRQALGQE